MTFIKRVTTLAAGLAMVAAPVAASAANPAAGLSVAHSPRAATTARDTSKLGASVPATTLISIGILAALVVIVLVSVGGSSDKPASR